MDTLIIKIFATALTLSQATTSPAALKTQFDRTADQEQVVALLKAGCQHMRQVFDIENINVEDLLGVAMQDADAIAGANNAVFPGLNFRDLNNAYRQFCTNETVGKCGLDLGAVIDFSNKTLADLPDDQRLRDYRKLATGCWTARDAISRMSSTATRSAFCS